MVLRGNTFYWIISLRNPEPVQDDYYIFDEIIISDRNLIIKIDRLRELIISYCVLLEKSSKVINEIFNEIFEIVVSIEKIQYHEFIAFWKVLDISYSSFKKLPDKENILKEILNKYCQRRRELYDKIGYSNVTVQALYDFGASRKKGVAANKKIIDLIKGFFENPIHAKTIQDFEYNSIVYFEPDKGGKVLFKQFCKKFNIAYEFGDHHQGKLHDILLKVEDHIFLIEAKHMKESGGAQDKQVVEIIEFIAYSEKDDNIHYVTFMDGIYFNRYAKNSIKSGKTGAQKDSIVKNLQKNKSNFFVNTAGLKQLFEDISCSNKSSNLEGYL